jgi:viroplasmin and RNaseH domain-containing protein
MEEKITEIILDNVFHKVGSTIFSAEETGAKPIAKEITDHVFEFIEWLFRNGSFTIGRNISNDIIAIMYGVNGYAISPQFTLKELYVYWLKNK